ncbi:MAG TPA: hypothetical protein VE974_06850 [Thermoanaerobaculia bacterium]|nr:hypothetical protein [Thermoanaerobaculia bacterium]
MSTNGIEEERQQVFREEVQRRQQQEVVEEEISIITGFILGSRTEGPA